MLEKTEKELIERELKIINKCSIIFGNIIEHGKLFKALYDGDDFINMKKSVMNLKSYFEEIEEYSKTLSELESILSNIDLYVNIESLYDYLSKKYSFIEFIFKDESNKRHILDVKAREDKIKRADFNDSVYKINDIYEACENCIYKKIGQPTIKLVNEWECTCSRGEIK